MAVYASGSMTPHAEGVQLELGPFTATVSQFFIYALPRKVLDETWLKVVYYI